MPERYIVTCECEILVEASGVAEAAAAAIEVLNSEPDIISGQVSNVEKSDIDPKWFC